MKYTSTLAISKKKCLNKIYGDFLEEKTWTFYCTLTTRYPLTLNSARRSVERLNEFIKINQNIQNEIFWVAEPFDTKYGYHIHALIKLHCPDELKRKNDIIKAWQNVTKGSYKEGYNHCLILPYRPNSGGNYYMSKSIWKSDIEYGFL